MLKIKKVKNNKEAGYSLVLLWIFTFTVLFQMDGRGDHLHFAFGIGPFEVSIGTSIWRPMP